MRVETRRLEAIGYFLAMGSLGAMIGLVMAWSLNLGFMVDMLGLLLGQGLAHYSILRWGDFDEDLLQRLRWGTLHVLRYSVLMLLTVYLLTNESSVWELMFTSMAELYCIIYVVVMTLMPQRQPVAHTLYDSTKLAVDYTPNFRRFKMPDVKSTFSEKLQGVTPDKNKNKQGSSNSSSPRPNPMGSSMGTTTSDDNNK